MDFQKFYFLPEAFGGSLKNTKDFLNLRSKYWPKISKLLKDVNIQGKSQSEFINPKDVGLSRGTFKLRVNKEGIPRIEAAKDLEKKIGSIKGLKVVAQKAEMGSNAPWLRIYSDGNEIFRFEFKDHPSSRVGGADYEPAIVNGWNKINGIKVKKEKVKPATEKTGLRIAKYLKENEINDDGVGVQFGLKSLGLGALSKFWIVNSEKPDSTPKTDVILSKRKISLKMGDAAQLASGKVIASDGSALVLTAFENSKVKPKLKKRIVDMVSRRNKRISGDKKTYMAMKASDILEFGKEYFRDYHRELTKLLREVVENNPDFTEALTYEAMIGEKKFKDKTARADFLLAASEDGSVVKFHSKDDSEYISKIASQVDVQVNFKSSRGSYYSALRITARKLLSNSNVNFGEVLAESFETAATEMGIDCKVINEGVVDWIKKIFNIIVEAIQKGLNYFLTLIGLRIDSVKIKDDNINFLV